MLKRTRGAVNSRKQLLFKHFTITPLLQTGVFSDPDTGDIHAMTRWQISTEAGFADVVFDLKTEKYLTSLPVPDSLINGNQSYHWRVQFIDNRYGASIWSDVFSFKTVGLVMQTVWPTG